MYRGPPNTRLFKKGDVIWFNKYPDKSMPVSNNPYIAKLGTVIDYEMEGDLQLCLIDFHSIPSKSCVIADNMQYTDNTGILYLSFKWLTFISDEKTIKEIRENALYSMESQYFLLRHYHRIYPDPEKNYDF